MRLSAYVRQHGIAAFTFEDFKFVGSKVATDPSRLVLVGGQALETWGVVLDVSSPGGAPLTEDTDWLGSKRDAQWLCALLGVDDTELKLAAIDEPASTGFALHRRPDGRVLAMDFLRCIIGPSNEEVRRLAVAVNVDGIVINVLHPLLCLESRLANIEALPAKRRGNGPAQAEWAIDIATAFLRKMLAESLPHRQIVRACHAIAGAAEFRHGRYCYEHFKIDPIRAVTDDVLASVGGKFETEDWPRTVNRIRLKQEHWAIMMAKAMAA